MQSSKPQGSERLGAGAEPGAGLVPAAGHAGPCRTLRPGCVLGTVG